MTRADDPPPIKWFRSYSKCYSSSPHRESAETEILREGFWIRRRREDNSTVSRLRIPHLKCEFSPTVAIPTKNEELPDDSTQGAAPFEWVSLKLEALSIWKGDWNKGAGNPLRWKSNESGFSRWIAWHGFTIRKARFSRNVWSITVNSTQWAFSPYWICKLRLENVWKNEEFDYCFVGKSKIHILFYEIILRSDVPFFLFLLKMGIIGFYMR